MRNNLTKIALVASFWLAMAFTISCDTGGFKTVKIGSQVWMAENLNIDIQGSKCYEDNPENCEKYGRLYYYGIAMQACPKGWHLPSNKEWRTLLDFVGGPEVAGEKLKSKSGWNDNYNGASGNGTDDFGFSALPGGYYRYSNFNSVGKEGRWWSATEDDASHTWARRMERNAEVSYGNYEKTSLFSVRCLKD